MRLAVASGDRNTPASTVTDRFGLALFIAAVVHGFVILGITFGAHMVPRPETPTLDVVLVGIRSPEAPEDAERIAQFDQQASGSGLDQSPPGAPLPALQTEATTEPTPLLTEASAATPVPAPEQILTAKRAPDAVPVPDAPVTAAQPDLEVAELIEQIRALARMASELRENEAFQTLGPRTHYIDADSARSAVEAAYIDEWSLRVERVGNLNYPDEARRRLLSGSPTLNVTLDSEGKVLDIMLVSSSGERVLDDAARRIVLLAAPFPPFPPAMRDRYDRLTISRTWIFSSKQGMRTR